MPDFKRIIDTIYREVLQRPGDTAGLDGWNTAMNNGLTYADVYERFLRSEEYAQKNPGQTPPPQPGNVRPLEVVDGNRFGVAGRPIELYGHCVCCSSDTPGVPDEAIARGWPCIVDDATLDLCAANRVNLVHVRLGPFRPAIPGVPDSGETAENIAYADAGAGRVDLDRWNPAFWSRLRTFLQSALSRGIYVQIDLIDCWVLDHEVGPWSIDRNVNAFEGGSLSVTRSLPMQRHEQWIAKCVSETGGFANVIYQDGNEAWKGGGSSMAWVARIGELIRQGTSRDQSSAAYRLYGTNTGRIDPNVDYVTFHQDVAHEALSVPVMVNEYPSRPPEQVLANVQIARDNGTVFFYWAGGHDAQTREETMRGVKAIAEGASPMPDQCPWLVRMGAKPHNIMGPNFQQLEDRIPVVGGFVVFDLTPRFSSDPNDPRGRPCNAEHMEACQGRPCEDERGGLWDQTEGPQINMHIQEHGFQLRVGPIPAATTYTFLCSPPPNYMDQLGKPVRVAANAAREVGFTVGVPA